ncbi:MAG: SIS domain-containing protein [Planctomycetes bacterium]|nr:SIS domain-containing protein [Planctomycetota bacterium]
MQMIARAAEAICRSHRSGGRLLVCGNGGSAADADHIVGELAKGFQRPRPLPEPLRAALLAAGMPEACRLQAGVAAFSLVAQGGLISAIANDQHPDLIFAQQVCAYGRPGDCLLALSTSGRSLNVLRAAQTARALGLIVIAFTGRDGGPLAPLADHAVRAPADGTAAVQELHLPLYHALCATIEAELFP